LAAAGQQLATTVARTEKAVPAQARLASTEVPQVTAEASQDRAGNLLVSVTAHDGRWGEAAGPVAIAGALPMVQVSEEEKWRCRVPTCTRNFHRLHRFHSSARWTRGTGWR